MCIRTVLGVLFVEVVEFAGGFGFVTWCLFGELFCWYVFAWDLFLGGFLANVCLFGGDSLGGRSSPESSLSTFMGFLKAGSFVLSLLSVRLDILCCDIARALVLLSCFAKHLLLPFLGV